jgi:RNA polymerase sigma-70 factor (ECF subfamily)
LPEAHRAVLVLRHYENLKFREIAGVLEIPEGTVKSRMAEALTQMARLLKPAAAAQEAGNLKSQNEPKESLVL